MSSFTSSVEDSDEIQMCALAPLSSTLNLVDPPCEASEQLPTLLAIPLVPSTTVSYLVTNDPI